MVHELRQAGMLVSVETYHPQVTRACLEAGANVLNLTGTEQTAELYRMVADHDAAVIICYVQGRNVREVGDFDFSADPVALMLDYFSRQIEIAERSGVQKILIDPGLRLLLSQPAGQCGAREASNEGFSEHLPPASAGVSLLPRPAACIRVFRGRGTVCRTLLLCPRSAWKNRAVSDTRSPAHQGGVGDDGGFLRRLTMAVFDKSVQLRIVPAPTFHNHASTVFQSPNLTEVGCL